MIYFNKKDIPDKFLIGVSGGVDSVSISFLLASRGYDFSLIHVNNKLIEGDDAAAEKTEQFAQFLNKRIYIVESSDKYVKSSKEEWARNQRIQAFKLIAEKFKEDYLLTAHHLGDILSGYVMNMMRGTPEYMPVPKVSHFGSLTILRPFLRNPKRVLEDYAAKNDLARFVTYDNLNDDTRLMRNFVRKDILPLLNSRVNLEKIVLKKFFLPPKRPSAF